VTRPTAVRLHDLVVGFLAGGSSGLVAGLALASRLATEPWGPIGGSAAGALGGMLWLSRLDPHRADLISPRVVVAWILLAASVILLAGLVLAMRGFA